MFTFNRVQDTGYRLQGARGDEKSVWDNETRDLKPVTCNLKPAPCNL